MSECAGRAARGPCQAPPVYTVFVAGRTYPVCGKHVAWALSRVLNPGQAATVRRDPR